MNVSAAQTQAAGKQRQDLPLFFFFLPQGGFFFLRSPSLVTGAKGGGAGTIRYCPVAAESSGHEQLSKYQPLVWLLWMF